MFRKVQNFIAQLSDAQPGERFIKLYERRQRKRHEHPVKSAFYVTVGILLIIVGTLTGFSPGIPGILIVLVGLGMIVARLRVVAMALDWMECTLRRCIKNIRSKR